MYLAQHELERVIIRLFYYYYYYCCCYCLLFKQEPSKLRLSVHHCLSFALVFTNQRGLIAPPHPLPRTHGLGFNCDPSICEPAVTCMSL